MTRYLKYIIPILLICLMRWCSCEVEPSTLMGLKSGEVLKCRFENSSECAPLTAQAQDSGVSALAVSGEFLYLGLQSGVLSRCPLARPHNCTTFHTFLSEINALAIAGKHIYAAWFDGITKCGLRKSDDCTIYYASESPVRSVTVFGDRLYAGTDEDMLSCPLSKPEHCSHASNLTSAVNALSASGDFLYVGLEEGVVEYCLLDDITDCTILFHTPSKIQSLDVFNNNILASLDTGDIFKYNVVSGSNESLPVSKTTSVSLSILTVYDTTNMVVEYQGEDSDCTWQPKSCPPYIVYYDIESRAQFELHVKDGKLYTITDEPYTSYSGRSKEAIFVMDPAGRIYSSCRCPTYFIYHSSMMAGAPVSAAGKMYVSYGVIKSINTCSEHYRPSLAMTKQILSALKRQGYEETVEVEECEESDLKTELDYNITYTMYNTAKNSKGSEKHKKLNLNV